jgi:FixJ family two-component response regulator
MGFDTCFHKRGQAVPSLSIRCAHCFGQDAMISIIDDDASVRAATYRLVCSLGYIAATFASASEFLRSPQLDHTSCVIADIQMPGMSGIELQNLLQTQGRKLPMIFITAFPEERVRAQALKSGAACVLSKPFNARTLIEYLDAVMKSHRGRSGE